jgi:hypothetical protein
MAEVLVSPLGRSPGAVSGVCFALEKQRHIKIDKVVTVGTSHPDVQTAASNYLVPLFASLDIDYDPIHAPEPELRHGLRHVKPYVALVELALQNAQEEDNRVHVAVTGGRSGMGALAALAANLYGADHLWHLWVKPEIEEGGTIDKLFGLTDGKAMQNSPFLNPTVEEGDDAYDLVDLPFLDLRPLHDVLWTYRRTGQVPDPGSPLARIFGHVGIDSFKDVFPAGMTFGEADRVLELKQEYVAADIQQRQRILVELGEILQRAGVVDKQERQRLIDLVNARAAPEALFDLAQEARRDWWGFWRWMKSHKGEIELTATMLGTLLKALELYFKANGYFS